MTQFPAGLPVLGGGGHEGPSEGACFMEYVSVLAGEEWADNPDCVENQLALAMQSINDTLTDETRQILVPLLTRSIGLAPKRPLRAPLGALLNDRKPSLADRQRYENDCTILQRVAWPIFAAKIGKSPDLFTDPHNEDDEPVEVHQVFMTIVNNLAVWEAQRVGDYTAVGHGGGGVSSSKVYAQVFYDHAVMLHEAYEEAMQQLGWERKVEPTRTVEQVAALVQEARGWTEEDADEWYASELARVHSEV